ncbi:conserved hypothetical protein [Pseudarthrobacter chlorophenolicus A6]|uniref:Uncharacterized protein n=1 Tax=Pseudarthrobacter chlorophenolicus (strain ATCC 700700 / DSM 12829 / CIP 107037 / JCM 12360 / KCTC 9906 / NCIMB 13794 / A6) TaxID=452863 RepID=B8HFJ2_PSECP|nr:hypothetical protein [Pseudarthrobacter chlorophenolicus]ACL39331.1 conserved hypothetical protein [Pseudarthrobacter chlorophenolicus A6]
MADSPEPTGSATATTAPGCEDDCSQEPTSPATEPVRPTRTKPADRPGSPTPAYPAPQPVLPTSAAPTSTGPAAPPATSGPAPTGGQGADGTAPGGQASDPATSAGPADATTSPGGAAPASGAPSSDSGWDTPVTTSARATQAAAVSRAEMSGRGGPDLPAVAAGVLLVGAGGGAFTWWIRNRPRTH